MIQEKLSGSGDRAITSRNWMSEEYDVDISNIPIMKEVKALYDAITKRSQRSAKKIFGKFVTKHNEEMQFKFVMDVVFGLKS